MSKRNGHIDRSEMLVEAIIQEILGINTNYVYGSVLKYGRNRALIWTSDGNISVDASGFRSLQPYQIVQVTKPVNGNNSGKLVAVFDGRYKPNENELFPNRPRLYLPQRTRP